MQKTNTQTNLVPPRRIDVWKLPVYVPKKEVPVRQGADNHKLIKSKGF